MPYAVTHILSAIILTELFRDYFIKKNKKFPRYYIFVAVLGAMIPDIDIAGYYVLSFFGFSFEQIHRTFFHTVFIPLILFLVGIFTYAAKIKNNEFGKRHITIHITFFILALGSLLHLILDAVLAGYIRPLYPFSSFQIGLNLVGLIPIARQDLILPTLDGIFLIFWIFWMEFKLKVRDYF